MVSGSSDLVIAILTSALAGQALRNQRQPYRGGGSSHVLVGGNVDPLVEFFAGSLGLFDSGTESAVTSPIAATASWNSFSAKSTGSSIAFAYDSNVLKSEGTFVSLENMEEVNNREIVGGSTGLNKGLADVGHENGSSATCFQRG